MKVMTVRTEFKGSNLKPLLSNLVRVTSVQFREPQAMSCHKHLLPWLLS